MRRITKIVVGFTVFLSVATGRAQNTVVEQGWVSVSRTLAGHADIGLDKVPAENIMVDVCSADWQTVIASTKTDKNGFFSLPKSKSGQLYYVRLSAYGVNPYQLRVRIKKHVPQDLRIHLQVAT
jgi:hypothetical protein